MVSYDLLRLFRFFVPHSSLWTGLEDFAYWIYCAIMSFWLLFQENSGVLRGYVIVSVFIGMYLYDRIVSQNVFGVLKKVKRWFTIKVRNRRQRKKARNHGTEPQ
ncbi:MAG: spore cortex biosynthesis protein YabQ [Lachnospiraceae bacterium]|nr:spore cortex biosynthesis protein YabQ [Lachnospiraceae bacterium]